MGWRCPRLRMKGLSGHDSAKPTTERRRGRLRSRSRRDTQGRFAGLLSSAPEGAERPRVQIPFLHAEIPALTHNVNRLSPRIYIPLTIAQYPTDITKLHRL